MERDNDRAKPLVVSIELGRTRIARDQLEAVGEQRLVTLEQPTDEPVDVLVDDQLVARAEIVVVDNRFCVRIVELVTHVNAVA